MEIKTRLGFFSTLVILLVLSVLAAFIRYIVFSDFEVYDSEESISESVSDQFHEVIEKGI
ncbi:MAG: hypothetical protein RLY66_201 [Candidatus Parcubacteria bacterium]|jgi:hypothetical protein